jgi:uncharacterized membrane protein YraQ (UPF0718 family)
MNICLFAYNLFSTEEFISESKGILHIFSKFINISPLEFIITKRNIGVYLSIEISSIISVELGGNVMDVLTLAMWIGTAAFLVFSLIKDKQKTKKALKMAFGMGRGMLGNILSIIFLIGLVLTVLPPENIAEFIGSQSLLSATIVSAGFGTITLVPAFIAFPLVGTLVNAGVGIVPAVAFLTTLTMVGIVTFPLEKREFGLKFTATRNGLSFAFAIVIALIMGVIL